LTTGLVLQVLLTGLATGAAYGLVGIGFALVFRLTGVVQIAHGDLIGGAIYLAIFIVNGTAAGGRSGVATWRVAAGYATALAAAGGAGALLSVVVRRATRDRSVITTVGVVAAVAFAVSGLVAVLFPRRGYVLADLLPLDRYHAVAVGDGAAVPARALWVLGVGIVVAGVAHLVLARSRFGLALRALTEDPTAARLVGIPVDRMLAGGFAVAGLLAAIAGLVVAPSGSVTPQTGALLGVYGIAAALVANLGSPARALAAGLTLGVVGTAAASLHVPGFPSLALGPAWRDLAPLLLVFVLLAVRTPSAAREAVE
jgi:branched-subunit amino acid ABC-type transport system permease component